MIQGNKSAARRRGASVSAAFAKGLLDLAVEKGADAKSLLQRSGIAAEALDDPDSRIPFARYIALMRAGKALATDPALAMHYGEVNIARISVIGLIGQASETMLEAFTQLNRYVKLVVDVDIGEGDRFQMRNERGGLWMVDTRQDANDFPELTESAFTQLVCGPRALGVKQIVTAVDFTHPQRSYLTEYERIFRVPIRFGAEWNAMRIDPALMMQPIAALPRYVFGVLTARGDALLAELEKAKTTRGRVERLLMPGLHKGDANIDSVAAAMGTTRQTLYRHLKAEGTTFERVLDDLRHRLALDYLQGRRVSVNQTAYLVGFSDPAAFSRAFKRWTGVNPRAARRHATQKD
ncbi:MAG TPA: AraC family transcriptional regulator [Rhizomicrobium sp.]